MLRVGGLDIGLFLNSRICLAVTLSFLLIVLSGCGGGSDGGSDSVAMDDLDEFYNRDVAALQALQVGGDDLSGLWVLLVREQLSDNYSRTYVAFDDTESELVVRECMNDTGGLVLQKVSGEAGSVLTLPPNDTFGLEALASDESVTVQMVSNRQLDFGELFVQANPNVPYSSDSRRAVSAWKIADTVPTSLGAITVEGQSEGIMCLSYVESTYSNHNANNFIISTYGSEPSSRATLELYTTREINHSDDDRTAILSLNNEYYQADDWGQSYRAFSLSKQTPFVYNGEYYIPQDGVVKEGTFSIDLRMLP